MANKEIDVEDTSDYKLSKNGKKIKAHCIIFNKGQDDGARGISEMKKQYKNFVEQHTPDLTEEQKNELVSELQEVLSKDASAGEWISDFVHSDNPKFKGKSKEKRKQMALAAYYAKSRNEEVNTLNNKDIEMNEANKISTAQMSHQGKTTIKHIDNPGVQLRMAAHDIKPGIKGYKDRIALLKAAQAQGKLKEEEETVEEASTFDWKNSPKQTKEKSSTSTYHDVKKISTGTVYTKQFDKDGTSKGTGEDAAKKAEGAEKRGRGRPKKDRFAESAEILMALSEEQFDSMMEEGFDAWMEAYEQLDELSKNTLKSYVNKASHSAVTKGAEFGSRKAASDEVERFTNRHMMNKSDETDKMKKAVGGDNASVEAARVKAMKRVKGINQAVNKLTK